MKDWNKISDEEFDDAFKEISLNHSENVWADAWPLMAEKLKDENRKRRFLIFWRSAAAILIFGTLGIISIGYFKKDSLDNKTVKIENSPQKQVAQIENETQKQITKAENSSEKQVVKENDLVNVPKAIKTSSEINTKVKTKNNFTQKNGSTFTQKQNLAKNKLKLKIEEENEIVKKGIITKELISKKLEREPTTIQNIDIEQVVETKELEITEKKTEKAEIQEPKEIVLINKETKSEEAYFSADTVIILSDKPSPVLTQNESNDNSEALPTENSKIFQKLALNLGFSPDYSKVVASEFGSMGYNLQVILDYKISQKWALRAGVIKSKKLYDAYPEDYTWPVKWGKPSSPLKEVTAACDMLDIPVSLSYQVLQKGPNKLYTSLGITNYKMMKEKYEYWYENDADPNLKWRKWEGSSGFFGAGIVNMSVGLERKLTNFLSVQVEPFVKIPVKNVGFGNVKLLTTGIFLNIKTQAPRKKIQPK